MPLDETALAQIRAIVREELAAPIVTDRILTHAEAKAYTKHKSDSAFARWCTRYHATSGTLGRYSRGKLDSALSRESDRWRQPKPAPRRPEPVETPPAVPPP